MVISPEDKEKLLKIGLKSIPSFGKEELDNIDYPYDNPLQAVYSSRRISPTETCSPPSRKLLKSIIADKNPKVILEIGVCLQQKTFTEILSKEKPPECVYIGVDICSKSSMRDEPNNVFTLRFNSCDRGPINEFVKSKGPVDILMIDGWHSINHALNDFLFVENLAENGVVVLHDTNAHPGPVMLLSVLDRAVWDVTKHFTDDEDWGLAVVKRQTKP